MNYFSVFAILYMTTFLYEMTEKWKHIGFTWGFLTLICILVLTGVDRLKFLVFLVASTAYILIFRFPEVANHVNFILIINIPLIIAILYSFLWSGTTDQDCFEIASPFLRLSLISAYFFAGFHKLNQDFFHPEVSCLGWFMGAFKDILIDSRTLGIPSAIILASGIAVLWIKLLRKPLGSLSRPIKYFLLGWLALIVVISGSILLMIAQGRVPLGLKALVILLVASVVIAWEILGAIFLWVPKFQGLILAFSATMHVSFALIGFVDFSSLAFALFLCFIPREYLTILDKNSKIKFFGHQIHRINVYFLISLLNSLLTGIHYQLGLNLGDMTFLQGMIFNIGIFSLMWPILLTLSSPQRLPWEGMPLLPRLFPLKAKSLPILAFASLILFFSMNSYLGLRTAGNFSMFSNLRTEGEYSNHFLLRSNPLKIWNYQEDIVKVLEIDDDTAEIGHKYRPLKGSTLPLIEFKKLIYKWTEANYTVPITFVHEGVTYSSADIVNDLVWSTPQRSWEMYLMDFRLVQLEGANECRW